MNGWSNPLGEGANLITNSAYDFNSATYTSNWDVRHAGVDLHASPGSNVYSIAGGTVVRIVRGTDPLQMVVIIRHQCPLCAVYAIYGHTYAVSSLREQMTVSSGQFLGTVRQAGSPSHLHFGVNTSASLADFINSTSGYGWGRVPESATLSAVGWHDPIVYLSSHPCSAKPSARTATVLVMDVSGSMGQSWQGGTKIDSAKNAALQFITHVEQENAVQGTEHWISVVGFSSDAHILLPLTNNYAQARQTIISLRATNSTNLGAGLIQGLQEVSRLPGQAQRYVTILSDGNSNTGLSKTQILAGPVAEARNAGICINTVGFGNKSSIDEEFLRRIALQSGCGRYEYAATGFDLFAAYIKIRHHSLGQVISGLSSFGQQVTTLAGHSISLGTFVMPSGQKELQVTLGWSKTGSMQLRLFDPDGRQVTASYPGARVYSAGQFAQAIVTSPMQGLWRVDALPSSTSLTGSEYFAIASTRPGGIAFALPVPVFSVGDYSFALPGNTPTWVLLLVSVVCIAIGVWQLLAEAGLL